MSRLTNEIDHSQNYALHRKRLSQTLMRDFPTCDRDDVQPESNLEPPPNVPIVCTGGERRYAFLEMKGHGT